MILGCKHRFKRYFVEVIVDSIILNLAMSIVTIKCSEGHNKVTLSVADYEIERVLRQQLI